MKLRRLSVLIISTFIILSNIFFTVKATTHDPVKQDDTNLVNSKKVAYLTFDDGPSKNTEKVLDILKEYNVKATFFVVGPLVPEDVQFMVRAYNEGHAIGNHTYDHDYEYVYANEEIFWKNYNKCNQYIESYIGKTPTIFRFPGGSFSSVVKYAHGKEFNQNIIRKLKNKGVEYYDWNVDSGDGMSNYVPAWILLKNVVNEVKLAQDKENIIVLMHDAKEKTTTVEALPSIIKYLMDNGYTFDTLENEPNN